VIATGSTLGGRYTLVSLIASGGMGDVWEATDDVLQRQVAVKVLRPMTDDESFLERFRDEARGSAALHHPNIASVFDYGEESGTAYLVMELVPGHTLTELIRRSGGADPALSGVEPALCAGMPPGEVRSIVGQAALALAAAHESGVVHRDVKPANIIVTPDGQVKLTDFGIARLGDGSGHTATGDVLGTPHYISPEAALGRTATPASDIYALGIVAHEMLTGRRPFDHPMPVATALAQIHDDPPPLPESVPADLRAVVASCLSKDQGERPPSARAVAAAVGAPGADTAYDGPPATGPARTAAGAAPLSSSPTAPAAVDPTRALPLQARRADMRAAAGDQATRGRATRGRATRGRGARGRPAGVRHVRRRWAWLAVPVVALIAWGAFALGGLVNTASTAAPPHQGTPTPRVPAASPTSTSQHVSTTSTQPTTTTTEPPSSTSQEPAHPGKGKGKGKGKT
jgi:serine/threonine-protein kinase